LGALLADSMLARIVGKEVNIEKWPLGYFFIANRK